MTNASRRFLVSGLIEFGPVTLFFIGASLYDFLSVPHNSSWRAVNVY